MAIFGSTYPKFKKGSNTILLEHAKIDVKTISDIIEHASVFTTAINRIPLGNYAEATIIVFLKKYDNPIAKFNELNQYKSEVIDEFYQYSDGNPYYIKESDIPCKFYISEVTPYYLETIHNYDVCRIKLKSVQYCYQIPTNEPVGWSDVGYGKNYGSYYGRQL